MEASIHAYDNLIIPQGVANSELQGLSFERAMLDASVDCIKIISVDGNLLTMNKAGCAALGMAEDSAFGMPWLPLLPESVHAAGHVAIAEARQGRNARFPGKSVLGDDTRYWDNLLTPITDANGRVQVILCVSRDVTANTLLERELEGALMREKLLAREMQHRIKNVFAVVSGLISVVEREAAGNGAPETSVRLLREKLASFARVSDVVFEPQDIGDIDQDYVDISLIVRSVMQPYANRYQAEGGPCAVLRQNLTPIVLFLHEFATNSVKYGALGAEAGNIGVSWSADADNLRLVWVERGGPTLSVPPSSRGFGSDMIDRIAQSAGGQMGAGGPDGPAQPAARLAALMANAQGDPACHTAVTANPVPR